MITSAVFSPLKPLIDNVELTPGIVKISLHMLLTTSVERVNVAPSWSWTCIKTAPLSSSGKNPWGTILNIKIIKNIIPKTVLNVFSGCFTK